MSLDIHPRIKYVTEISFSEEEKTKKRGNFVLGLLKNVTVMTSV